MVIEDLVAKLHFDVEEKPLHHLEETLEHMKGRLEFLAAAEVIKGIYELGEKFAGVGEKIETAAVSAGVTAEAFQKLTFAASQSAVGQEELSGAMAKLNRNLYNAKNGSDKAAQSFEAVGITPDQIAGFRNSSDALHAVANAFQNIDDPIKRQAVAMELFGRGSYTMVKFLAKGGDAMDKLGEQAEGMGAVLTDVQVEDLAKLEDTFSGLGDVIKSFLATIAADFAPAMIDAVHAIEKFWGANQKMINQRIVEWAGEASYAFGFVTETVRLAVKAVLDFADAHPVLTKRIGEAVLGLMALSLVLGAVQGIVTTLFGPLAKMGKAFMAVGKHGPKAFKAVGWAASFLKGGLVKLGLKIAVMTATWLPALSEALLGIAGALEAMTAGTFLLWFGGILAIVGAVVLGVQALWAMLHGKSFWDTWLGEGLQAIMKYGSKAIGYVKGIFGFKGKDADKADAGVDLGETPEHKLARMNDALNMSDIVAKGTNGMANLQALALPPGMGSASDPSGAMMPAMPVAYTLNTTNNITVPPGMDPKDAGPFIQKGIEAATDRHYREAGRGLQTAAVR